MSKPKGRYEDFLGSVFGHPAAEVLERMYFQEQMSTSDIHAWLVDNIGWSVCERQISKIMSDAGVQLRGYVDRKRLSWAQGKMDEALAKSQEGCRQAYFIGCSAEKMVKYLLLVSLTALKLPWHVVIGDQLQIILSRYEVDIPVVGSRSSDGAQLPVRRGGRYYVCARIGGGPGAGSHEGQCSQRCGLERLPSERRQLITHSHSPSGG